MFKAFTASRESDDSPGSAAAGTAFDPAVRPAGE
jgi:hypothetical protein